MAVAGDQASLNEAIGSRFDPDTVCSAGVHLCTLELPESLVTDYHTGSRSRRHSATIHIEGPTVNLDTVHAFRLVQLCQCDVEHLRVLRPGPKHWPRVAALDDNVGQNPHPQNFDRFRQRDCLSVSTFEDNDVVSWPRSFDC